MLRRVSPSRQSVSSPLRVILVLSKVSFTSTDVEHDAGEGRHELALRGIDVGHLEGDEEQDDGEQVEQQFHDFTVARGGCPGVRLAWPLVMQSGAGFQVRITGYANFARSITMAERTRNRRNTLERRCLPKSLKRLFKGSTRTVFKMLEKVKKA